MNPMQDQTFGRGATFLMAATLATSLAASLAFAADPEPAAAAAVPKVVYLYGVTGLDELRKANPKHYAEAQRVIAAADELCKPDPNEVQYVRFEARNISCQHMFLRTSNPPKRQLSFSLDDTRYIALVPVMAEPPRFLPAR